MQDTSIAWADWTWNPIRGCSRISPGCQHCYAEKTAGRFAVVKGKDGHPVDGPFGGFVTIRDVGDRTEAHWTGKVELIESKLLEPLSWRRKAAKFRAEHGRKPRAFISMSDLFHELLPDEAIDRVMAVAALTQEVNWMFLTKRAERMAEYFSDSRYEDGIDEEIHALPGSLDETWHYNWPFANIALGVSVESQKYADERIPHLLRTPAAMRFVSYEPALEAVDFTSIEWPNKGGRRVDALRAGYWNKEGYVAFGPSANLGDPRGGFTNHSDMSALDMIIVGGESGPGARPFDIAWARQTVKQCRAANVAPFVKQIGSNMNGEWPEFPNWDPDANGYPIRNRKGEDMSEWPWDLRVREWPEGWN